MALAITSITPNTGATAGKTRVTIEGTDFDIHPYPPASSGYIGTSLRASVVVKFGLLEASNVWVYPKIGGVAGETVIECSTPRYTGDPKLLPALVSVTVTNQINPATVVATNGYKYAHQNVASESNNSALACVTMSLRQEMFRQVPVKDVVIRVHTDYDDDTLDGLNIVKLADYPALIISGPSIARSDGIYRAPDREDVVAVGDTRVYRASTVVDLSYTLTIVDQSSRRLLNLTTILSDFVDENGRLAVELIQGDPSQGFVLFDMDWETMPAVNTTASKDNLISSSGTIVIHGVPFDRVGGIELEKTNNVDEIVLDTELLEL